MEISTDAVTTVGFLTSLAQWKLHIPETGGEVLSKTFLLGDEAQAKRFGAQVDDLRSAQPDTSPVIAYDVTPLAASVIVEIRGQTIGDEISADAADLASAVDDLGAALQLQGKWG